MIEEERFAWDQLVSPWTRQGKSKNRSLIFIDVNAVMPILNEAPLLNRLEHDIAEYHEGWENFSAEPGLNNWQARVGEKCREFDYGYALGPQHEVSRMSRLGGVMRPYFAQQHFDWARIMHTHWDPPPMQAFNAIWAGVDRVRGQGVDVGMISVWLNAPRSFCEDLTDHATIYDLGGDLNVHRVHPVLGLLSDQLPLPKELQYLEAHFQFREARNEAIQKKAMNSDEPAETTEQGEED